MSRSSCAAAAEPLRAELPVTDRTGRCLLTDGEYDVLLTGEPAGQPAATPARPGANSPRKTSWESFDDGKVNFINMQEMTKITSGKKKDL